MSELTELQEHLSLLKKQVELRDQLFRLRNNNDFISVITEGFCKEELQRHMGMAVCERISSDDRELHNQLAKASSTLENYFVTLIQFGNNAEQDIALVEDRIKEIELNGGAE